MNRHLPLYRRLPLWALWATAPEPPAPEPPAPEPPAPLVWGSGLISEPPAVVVATPPAPPSVEELRGHARAEALAPLFVTVRRRLPWPAVLLLAAKLKRRCRRLRRLGEVRAGGWGRR